MANNNQSQEEDRALVIAAGLGDPHAASKLVDKYYNRIYNAIQKVLENPEDAKDATQEAFLQVFRAAHRFQNRCQFYTWLYKIALNCAFDIRRSHRKHHPFIEDRQNASQKERVDHNTYNQPMKNAEFLDEISRVRKGLQFLGADYRDVLILKEVEEMDYQTISEVLDIPVGTVRSRLHRARQELRWILEQWETRPTQSIEGEYFGHN